MAESERSLERWCAKCATDHGAWLPKWVSPGTKGVPDRILFLPGRVIFIEFKKWGQHPTKIQQHYLDKIGDLDAYATVIRSRAQFMEFFNA